MTSCNNGPADEFDNGLKLKYDNSGYTFEEVDDKNKSASYEIFVRSFYDSNKDGIGDLKGVQEQLPYLDDLGVKTLWLMPIHTSGSYHGYDVWDYYSINPDYGKMADFENLVAAAKERNMDIMLDLVINHSGTFNRWFDQSYTDFINNATGEDSKADWYNWKTTSAAGYHSYKNAYYEGSFNSTMPDLNLDSATLKEELKNIVKFWLDKGVMGFRLDAVTYYYSSNVTKNVNFLNWLNGVVKSINPNAYIVGEAWASDAVIKQYYGSSSKTTIDSFFAFGSAAGSTNITVSLINASKGVLSASKFSKNIEAYEKAIKTANPNAYASYFVTNHDMDRMSAYFKDLSKAKAVASLYLLMPGTPFIYYGEEIQMKGTRITSPDDASDVRRRLPMIWNKEDKTGECKFPETDRMDLAKNDQVESGVYDELKNKNSLVNHYRKVINVRNKYSVFKNGIYTDLTPTLNINSEKDQVLAYKISYNDEYVIVVHNFSDYNQKVTSPGTELLDTINTDQRVSELRGEELIIAHHSTVILK